MMMKTLLNHIIFECALTAFFSRVEANISLASTLTPPQYNMDAGRVLFVMADQMAEYKTYLHSQGLDIVILGVDQDYNEDEDIHDTIFECMIISN